ncbi:MAG: hypothetical protein PHX79_05085 [Sphaerochaetaceae bacterium]|nr:hypothetical protein [Sphaerochaetaceae bacterium]
MTNLSGSNSSFKQYIFKSWQQCTSLAIDPELKTAPKVTEEDFLLICQKRKHLLLNIARPVINKFSPFFDYSEYIAALTDENGTILYIYGKDT